MAHENKPSIYSDRGNIGSAEELDKYGVWVKSEPQEMSFIGESDGGLDDLPLPDFGETPDFAAGPGAMELSIPDDVFANAPLPDIMDFSIPEAGVELEEELAIPDIDFPEDADAFSAGFDEAPAAERAAASGDLSTQLLMKIADELSSIRNELSTLKKEFAGLQSVGGEKADAVQGGFFGEVDDEKIALTGDEMDTILHTAELDKESLETETGFSLDALAEETAVPELDELVVEAAEPAEPEETQTGDDAGQEEIEIDLEDLGINLDNIESEVDAAGEPSGNAAGTGAFDIDISPDENLVEENIALDDTELDDIESEADAAGEPSGGAAGTGAFDIDISPDENLVEENIALDDTEDDIGVLEHIREEGIAPMSTPPENTAYLEDDPLAGFSAEIALDGEDGPEAKPAAADDEALDISLDESSLDLDIDEAVFDDLTEDAVPAEGDITDEPPFDAAAFDTSFEADAAGAESVDKAAAPVDDTALAGEAAGSFDLPDELPEAAIEEPDAAETAGVEIAKSADTEIAENPADEGAFELDEIALDGELDIELEEGGETAEDALGATDEAAALPLDTEETLEIALDHTDDAGDESLIDNSLIDDSIAQVIPEGFEIAAEETPVPFDDDMEPFAEEDIAEVEPLEEAEAEAAGTEAPHEESLNIPSGIKTELKNVLSYMDHLLESLPEEKIEEFAKSEYFDSYKKLFKELGLV